MFAIRAASVLCAVLFLATATTASASLYMAFYDDDPTVTAEFTNLRIAVRDAKEAEEAAELGLESFFYLGGLWNYTSKHLRDDWEKEWNETAVVARELLLKKKIAGFNLGDEIVWNCMDPDDLIIATNAVRASFPRGSATIWYNEATAPVVSGTNACGEKVNYSIPSQLDLFSVDIYHMNGIVQNWVQNSVRSFYETHIFPNLTESTQRVLLVPGAFGSDVNHYPNGTYICNRTCYDAMCAHDAHDFFEWANEDPRVAGIAVWNWGGCPTCNGSRFTPPHTCCMDEIGAKDVPETRAAWEAIGREIKRTNLPWGIE